MGAAIQWHIGTIRFGPRFEKHGDAWTGKLTLMADLYEPDVCHLFVVAGNITLSDHRNILRLCHKLGYARMRETRRGVKIETDLTAEPFRRRAL